MGLKGGGPQQVHPASQAEVPGGDAPASRASQNGGLDSLLGKEDPAVRGRLGSLASYGTTDTGGHGVRSRKVSIHFDEIGARTENPSLKARSASAKSFDEGSEMRLRQLKFRSSFHEHIALNVIEHPYFTGFVMTTILLNVLSMAVETDRQVSMESRFAFDGIDSFSIAVYCVEFLLKMYVSPSGYWRNAYNRFDFVILCLSLLDFVSAFFGNALKGAFNLKFLRILRALRALRAMRGISFIGPLQVFVSAIVSTLKSVVTMVLLLFILMYIFAVSAYYVFGDYGTASWSSLGQVLFTLSDFVTADNWQGFTQEVDPFNVGIRYYAVAFLCVCHLLFTNLFVGVVIENLDAATEEDEKRRREQRASRIDAKKRAMRERLLAEAASGIAPAGGLPPGAPGAEEADVSALVERAAAGLAQEEKVSTANVACSAVWLSTFLATLEFQEGFMHRRQQLNFELARVLAELYERRLQAAIVHPGASRSGAAPPPRPGPAAGIALGASTPRAGGAGAGAGPSGASPACGPPGRGPPSVHAPAQPPSGRASPVAPGRASRAPRAARCRGSPRGPARGGPPRERTVSESESLQAGGRRGSYGPARSSFGPGRHLSSVPGSALSPPGSQLSLPPGPDPNSGSDGDGGAAASGAGPGPGPGRRLVQRRRSSTQLVLAEMLGTSTLLDALEPLRNPAHAAPPAHQSDGEGGGPGTARGGDLGPTVESRILSPARTPRTGSTVTRVHRSGSIAGARGPSSPELAATIPPLDLPPAQPPRPVPPLSLPNAIASPPRSQPDHAP
eukprot:tig00021428_g21160.t1